MKLLALFEEIIGMRKFIINKSKHDYVLKNPTLEELIDLEKDVKDKGKSDTDGIRYVYILKNKDIYFWDAYEMAHYQFFRGLKIKDERIVGSIFRRKGRFITEKASYERNSDREPYLWGNQTVHKYRKEFTNKLKKYHITMVN